MQNRISYKSWFFNWLHYMIHNAGWKLNPSLFGVERKEKHLTSQSWEKWQLHFAVFLSLQTRLIVQLYRTTRSYLTTYNNNIIKDSTLDNDTILFGSTEEKLCNKVLCGITFRNIFHEPCDMCNNLFIAEILVKSIRW